jgi:pyruvate ferredoxin oxidoreductase alpha subunit
VADQVAAFLPPFQAGEIRFRASAPESQAVAVLGGGPYSYFRYETHLAVRNGLPVYEEVAADFAEVIGRHYPAVECYRCEGAELLFVMIGSFATKAKAAVDSLRESGWSIGLLRPRLLRPFPDAEIRRLLSGRQAVAVIDQNLSFGAGGVLHGELATALYGQPSAPPVLASFIGGLGGRDIPPEEFYEIARVLREAAASGETPPPRLLYTESELRETRKLQAIARVERAELGVES